MAEIISAWIAVAQIVLLLCFFIPAATYSLDRLRQYARKRTIGFRIVDIAMFMLTTAILWLMITIIVEAQQLRPRCEETIHPNQMHCAQHRGDTSSIIILPRDQAEAWMRSDMLHDAVTWVIVPSIVGVAGGSVLLAIIRWGTTRSG